MVGVAARGRPTGEDTPRCQGAQDTPVNGPKGPHGNSIYLRPIMKRRLRFLCSSPFGPHFRTCFDGFHFHRSNLLLPHFKKNLLLPFSAGGRRPLLPRFVSAVPEALFPCGCGVLPRPPLFILLVLIPKPAAVVRVTRLRQHVVIRQVLSVCGEVHLDFVRFEPFLCERCRVERASLSIGHRH